MSSRLHENSGWRKESGFPRFLWTDIGALTGVLAVAGYAVYQIWI